MCVRACVRVRVSSFEFTHVLSETFFKSPILYEIHFITILQPVSELLGKEKSPPVTSFHVCRHTLLWKSAACSPRQTSFARFTCTCTPVGKLLCGKSAISDVKRFKLEQLFLSLLFSPVIYSDIYSAKTTEQIDCNENIVQLHSTFFF